MSEHQWRIGGRSATDARDKMLYRGHIVKKAYYRGKVVWEANEGGEWTLSPTSGNPSYNPNYVYVSGGAFYPRTDYYYAGNLMTAGSESGYLMGCNVDRSFLRSIQTFQFWYYDLGEHHYLGTIAPNGCLVTPLALLAISPDSFTLGIADAVMRSVGNARCYWRYHMEGAYMFLEVCAFTDDSHISYENHTWETVESFGEPQERQARRPDILGGETVSAYYASSELLNDSLYGNFDVVIRLTVSLETGIVVGKEVIADMSSALPILSKNDSVLCVWTTWKGLGAKPLWFDNGENAVICFGDGTPLTESDYEDYHCAYYGYVPGIIGNVDRMLLWFTNNDGALSYSVRTGTPVEVAPDFYKENGMASFLGYDIVLYGAANNDYLSNLPYAANTWLIWMEEHVPFFAMMIRGVPVANYITGVMEFERLSEIVEIEAIVRYDMDNDDPNTAVLYSWSVDNATYSEEQGAGDFRSAENKAAMVNAVHESGVKSLFIRAHLNTTAAALRSLTITYK